MKETLEEAIKREYEVRKYNSDFPFEPQSFKLGAKWQQEQDKNKYSEEEVRTLLINFSNDRTFLKKDVATLWFEQSKKQEFLDLDKLESKLDNALNIETSESLTEWIGNKRNNDFDIEKLAESIYGKGVKEDYEEGFVDGYNKAKENYEVTSPIRELHQYKIGLNDGYNKAKESMAKQTLVETIEEHYTRYVKELQEEVQLLKEIKDINEKIIEVKKEIIAELQKKVNELLKLLNEATSLIKN